MKVLGRHSEIPSQCSLFMEKVSSLSAGYEKHGFHDNLKTIYDGKMTKLEPHSLLHI